MVSLRLGYRMTVTSSFSLVAISFASEFLFRSVEEILTMVRQNIQPHFGCTCNFELCNQSDPRFSSSWVSCGSYVKNSGSALVLIFQL